MTEFWCAAAVYPVFAFFARMNGSDDDDDGGGYVPNQCISP